MITLQSALNVGSTFTVTLELPVAQEHLPTVDCNGLPLLLIDRDPALLESISRSLAEAGCTADAAFTAAEGIQTAVSRGNGDKPYRFIFVDWDMTDPSGSAVIAQLREALGSRVQLVAMTTRTVAEIEHEARHIGTDAFLTKPLYKSKLLALLTAGLSSKNSAAARKQEAYPDVHILVAEDNDTNWKVVHRLLRFYEIEAVRAVNGREAVEKMQTAAPTPDLIFMDIQMPVMNGYEATRAIRSLPDADKAAVPIYAMTADTFADDVQKCTDAGMNGHLPKPIDIQKMLGIIRAIAAAKQGGNETTHRTE